jgi:hypothetical protein
MNRLSIEETKADSNIRPENKRIIELLKQWVQEPDELGKNWWDSFEKQLAANRISFGERIRDGVA